MDRVLRSSDGSGTCYGFNLSSLTKSFDGHAANQKMAQRGTQLAHARILHAFEGHG